MFLEDIASLIKNVYNGNGVLFQCLIAKENGKWSVYWRPFQDGEPKDSWGLKKNKIKTKKAAIEHMEKFIEKKLNDLLTKRR